MPFSIQTFLNLFLYTVFGRTLREYISLKWSFQMIKLKYRMVIILKSVINNMIYILSPTHLCSLTQHLDEYKWSFKIEFHLLRDTPYSYLNTKGEKTCGLHAVADMHVLHTSASYWHLSHLLFLPQSSAGLLLPIWPWQNLI